MNKLNGTVIAIESSRHMSLVDIDVNGDVFTSIVLETPSSASYLKKGTSVTLLFKETEVSIAKNLSGLISMRNRFKATVIRIEHSDLLSKIFLRYKNKELVSIITFRSCLKLGLNQDDDVEWLVKTNEITLTNEE